VISSVVSGWPAELCYDYLVALGPMGRRTMWFAGVLWFRRAWWVVPADSARSWDGIRGRFGEAHATGPAVLLVLPAFGAGGFGPTGPCRSGVAGSGRVRAGPRSGAGVVLVARGGLGGSVENTPPSVRSVCLIGWPCSGLAGLRAGRVGR